MIYVSIDIETTGLDNDNSQVLSIGLVIEDTNNLKPFDELPKLEVAIIRERLEGEIFALNMNKELISDILSYKIAKTPEAKAEILERTGREYLYEEDVTRRIFHFLYDHKALDGGPDTFNPLYQNRVVEVINGKTYPALTSKMKPYYFNGAGKNFANFDNKFLERLPRWKQVLKARGRTIDPSILFVDWKNDEAIPGLSLCKERAKMDPHVTHNAIDDAMDIVKLLRTQYA